MEKEGKVSTLIEDLEGGEITSIVVFKRRLIVLQSHNIRVYDLKVNRERNV